MYPRLDCFIGMVMSAIIAVIASDAFASDEAVLLLMRAFEHRGDNPSLIQSGKAEFDVTTKNIAQDSSEEITRKHIKILMIGNNIQSRTGNPKECKRFLEEHTLPTNLGDISLNTFTLTMGYENPSDSCVAFVWRPSMRLLERFRGQRDFSPLGIPEFQQFGRYRLSFEFLLILAAKMTKKNYQYPDELFSNNAVDILREGMKLKGLTCEITGEIKYDDTATAKVIEIKKGETCVEKYHIDTERGFLCPYLWSGNENASFVFSAKNYIQEKKSLLYYPQFYSASSVMPRVNVSQTEEFRLVPNTLRFNQSISDKEFSLDIPAGANVHDQTPLKSFMGLTKNEVADFLSKEKKEREIMTYHAISKGTISFADDSYEIEKLPWIEPMETYKSQEEILAEIEEQKKNGNVYHRIGYILFGILLIVITLWLIRKRKG